VLSYRPQVAAPAALLPVGSRIIEKFMTVLADIIAATRRTVEEARAHADVRELERKAALHTPRGFRRAIEQASQSRPAIIAELKKASPSRGLIRSEFDPRLLAQELEIAGAAALSILTNGEFFQGSLSNLQVASAETSLPCLQKEFVVDELQVLEARANSADAILLIVAALSDDELLSLSKRATELGLDVLCEVHDEEELGRALDGGFELIGINNRDLQSFKVNLDTAHRLAQLLPPGVVTVAESGIETGSDISQLRSAGYNGFLIGETLMRAPRPGEALRALLNDAVSTAASGA
jgi:indole-3-glycerol phosphate synthase